MNLKPAILQILDRMSGTPMTEASMVNSVRLVHPGLPDGDIKSALNRFQAEGLIVGRTNEVLETTTWTITDKGTHQLNKL